MTALISIKNLHNQFGSQVVHHELCLDILHNEILAIIGGSGTGKSVLLNSIVGLQRPQQGEIYFNGEELLGMDDERLEQIKNHWGMLFQSGALYSSLTVGENVMSPMQEFSPLDSSSREELMQIKLNMVGLDPDVVRNKFPSELSGGMIKRVALARALALDPLVLFLDEPTSGLDPISAAEFDELIASLQQNLGLCVVMVTHDMDSLFSVCDRIAVIVDQKIVAGTVDEILAYDHPWIKQYFSSARATARIHERARSGKGAPPEVTAGKL